MKEEYRTRLDDCLNELENIKRRIDKDQFDDMVQFLQRYAIIKSCGTIEYIIKNMISDCVEQGAKDEISKYVNKMVRESSANPKTGKISALLCDFSPDNWKKSFDDGLNNMEQQKSSLNSLVQLRNDFAHGKSPNTSINTVINYYKLSCEIVELVDRILDDT